MVKYHIPLNENLKNCDTFKVYNWIDIFYIILLIGNEGDAL